MNETKITQRKKHHAWVFSFFVACFLFSVNLSAQNYPPLVSETLAQTMLISEIPVLENVLNNLSPGSPAFELAERKLHLYQHTWEFVFSGKNLTEALTAAFGEFATDANGNPMSEDELPLLSKTGPDYGDTAFDDLVGFLEQ